MPESAPAALLVRRADRLRSRLPWSDRQPSLPPPLPRPPLPWSPRPPRQQRPARLAGPRTARLIRVSARPPVRVVAAQTENNNEPGGQDADKGKDKSKGKSKGKDKGKG